MENFIRKQLNKINMKQEFVNFKIFIWAISIIITLFGISFGMIANAQLKADGAYQSIYQIKTDIEVIKTDVNWIKNNI